MDLYKISITKSMLSLEDSCLSPKKSDYDELNPKFEVSLVWMKKIEHEFLEF